MVIEKLILRSRSGLGGVEPPRLGFCRRGKILGGVEIEGEFREIDGGNAGGGIVDEGASAFFAGERGERGKIFRKKQGGRTVPAAVVRGNDAATGGALGRDELRDGVGGKCGLIAEGDERGVELPGELLEGCHADANRGSHALRPSRILGDEHRQPGEQWADFFRVRTEHDDDRPRGRSERGFDGADEQRLAVDDEELFRRAHARRFPGSENHGAEPEVFAARKPKFRRR